MAELDLALLGPPVVTRDGGPVSFDTRKATAVLALLAVHDHELSRERLAALLWPEADAARARASLRRTLSVTAAARYVVEMPYDRPNSTTSAGRPARVRA